MEISGEFGAFESSITSTYYTHVNCPFGAASSDMTLDEWSDYHGYLSCLAHSSCRDAIVVSSLTEAFGPYSLANSTIQSIGDGDYNAVIITFWGYKSGQNAKVICQDDDECYVQCFGVSACENMECIGTGCDVVYTYTSTGDETVFDYDVFDLLTSRDAECNQNGAVTYDIADEHSNGDTITANSIVCCRGDQSCLFNKGIFALGNSVVCGGYRSCFHWYDTISFIAADEVLCTGSDSCNLAIITAPNIYCLGKASCAGATINMLPNGFLDCAAYASCQQATIESPGNGANVSIQFSGGRSFYYTTIVCKESDICNIVFLAETDRGNTIGPAITCEGQCNIEKPQVFRPPGLFFINLLAHVCM